MWKEIGIRVEKISFRVEDAIVQVGKGGTGMQLVKCPRCDLNYILDGEKLCKVCQRELKGDRRDNEIELCSICNEAPALPGKDVCLFCLKEMNKSNNTPDEELTEAEPVDTSSIGDMDSVSGMDEIIPDVEENSDIPSQEFGEIENELSLDDVIEDEEREAEKDEQEEDL